MQRSTWVFRACGILLSMAVSLALGGWDLPAAAQAPGKPAGRLEVEPDDLQPGLVAFYRSLVDRDATLARLDAKPAFTLGHSSPHPRLHPGPFEVVWTGLLFLKDPAPISFEAYLCGEATIQVDGVTVLQGRGENEHVLVGPREALKRPPGFYRLEIRYRSLGNLPARLQIWWQGPTFTREVLPAWHFQHLAAELPKAVAQQQLAEKGRRAVGKLGCARCHSGAFPSITEPPPGPSLADAGRRIARGWLLDWLAAPAQVRLGAHMPALFTPDRKGFVERWLVTEYLLGPSAIAAEGRQPKADSRQPTADHRLGRRHFISLGCATCHFLPDMDRAEQPDFERTPLTGLHDRLPAEELTAFLGNPHARYPDGRMPGLPMAPTVARDIAAYLLLWSKSAQAEAVASKPPTPQEINEVSRRLGARGSPSAAGAALIREKRCAECHPGLGQSIPANVPLTTTEDSRGCLSSKSLPHFTIDPQTQKTIAAYRAVAGREKHPAPFANRQMLLERRGCVRCHQRDSDRPPLIEAIGSTLGGAWLQNVPFQRTPRLTYPLQKYTRAHLLATVREGVSGLRPARYSYVMPAFGHDAEALVAALAEADGELPAGVEPPPAQVADRTLGTLHGPNLVGFQGYACVSCHIWKGQSFSEPDPGAIGTDLTRVPGRIRRDWFDRFLEGPARFHPGTPMPAIFFKGKPALLPSVLEGDPGKQKDALWSYFALGKEAPSPKPPPPLPVIAPAPGEPPVVAQIPLRLSLTLDSASKRGEGVLESICVLYGSHDLLVYDVGTCTLHSAYTGAQLLRGVHGRLRTYAVAGTAIGYQQAAIGLRPTADSRQPNADSRMPNAEGRSEVPSTLTFHGYDRLADGVRLRWQAQFAAGTVEVVEVLKLRAESTKRWLVREFQLGGVPAGRSVELRSQVPTGLAVTIAAPSGAAKGTTVNGTFQAVLTADGKRTAAATLRYELPAAAAPPSVQQPVLAEPAKIDGELERPGYRAIVYPRPRTISGEDLIMPSAVAVNPKDGRVFVASTKLGEIFVLHDPSGDGKSARFDNYARGLFQEAYSMLAEPDALYVLHRRNLTKVIDTDSDGVADRFDRVAALPHGVGETYDYGYGLVRDKSGAFVFSYAPYAHTDLPGSGGALRLVPGQQPREIAFGFRNPVGWCTGPDGEVFCTDNQGEWVATNKLCHIVAGRFYGFPNPAQRQHTTKPFGKTTIWVPYAWAKSINGVTYDNTGGKFGPFAGQIFMAELMFGGAIVRANLEKVNGEYQGACFPFWGQGLLGPLSLAFDPKGRLFVGSITEPGWMAQPDRGALFRIDYTGQVPFEMQSIHVLPRGFRIIFTAPVAPATALNLASYQVEHYRYEYTGAYGSPELDRRQVAIERVELSPDGRSADLITAPLVKDRVYMIHARGVRSAIGEPLVHPTGAYTLNQIPAAPK